jgi:hypothetical protein
MCLAKEVESWIQNDVCGRVRFKPTLEAALVSSLECSEKTEFTLRGHADLVTWYIRSLSAFD